MGFRFTSSALYPLDLVDQGSLSVLVVACCNCTLPASLIRLRLDCDGNAEQWVVQVTRHQGFEMNLVDHAISPSAL